MRIRYKIVILASVLALGGISAGLHFDQVKAATRRIVNTFRFNDGVAGYWRFDGIDISGVSATDRSGNGNTGTLTNGPTAVPGISGQALNFDGVNDYVSVSDSSNQVIPAGNAAFSISMWFRPAVNTFTNVSGDVKSLTVNETYTVSGFRFGINNTANTKLAFWSTESGGDISVTSSTNIVDNNWYHAVVSYTGSSATLYLNGVLEATDSSGTVISNTNTVSIAKAIGGKSYFGGNIDEVRIYNRALSAAEVAYQYNKTKPAGGGGSSGTVANSVPNSNGLVGWWNFDDCDTCTTVRDMSGNSNNGTMYSAAGPTVGNLHTASSTTSGFTGRIGGGGLFDGDDDYIQVTDPINGSLDFGATDNLTMSAWVRVTAAATTEIIMGKRLSTTSGYIMYFGSTLANIVVQLRDGGLLTFVSKTIPSSPLNSWHYVAATINHSTNTLTYYWDGVAFDTDDISGVTGSLANTADFFMGRDAIDSTNRFIGVIDEVRIYNRALSADEVKNLYNSTRTMFVGAAPKNLVKDGLVGYWSFNGPDMYTNTAYDRSGSGNNGTLNGGPTSVPGMVSQALNFDGTGDFVDAGANSITGTNPFTISAWINTRQLSQYSGAVAMGASATNNSAYIGTVAAAQVGTSNSIGGGFYGRNYGSGITTTGQWAHVAMTFAGGAGGAAAIYVNGQNLVGEAYTPNLTVGAVKIGRIGTDTLYDFNGSVDEVRIYNRALSAAEITTLYNAGKQ